MKPDTPCAEAPCKRTAAMGYVMHRVNPKGQEGVFMCAEHEADTWGEDPKNAARKLAA